MQLRSRRSWERWSSSLRLDPEGDSRVHGFGGCNRNRVRSTRDQVHPILQFVAKSAAFRVHVALQATIVRKAEPILATLAEAAANELGEFRVGDLCEARTVAEQPVGTRRSQGLGR